MKRYHALILSATLVAVLLETAGGEPPAEAAGLRWSLGRCQEEAVANHPDLAAAKHAIEAAVASRKAIRGAFFPTLKLEANVMRWDSELTADFGSSMGSLLSPTSLDLSLLPRAESDFDHEFDARIIQWFMALGQSLGGGEPMVIREAWTGSVSLTLAQPLTPLYTIVHAHRAKELEVDASRQALSAAEADVALRVTEAYLGLLKVQKLAAVARAAVEQLEAHQERVRVLAEGGVAQRNDVLKVEVGLANARQGLIQAQAGAELAGANLAVQVGLAPGTTIVPDGSDVPAELPAFDVSLAEVERRVLERRAELATLDTRRDQAVEGRKIAWGKLIPNVVLLGTYSHSEGTGSFQSPDSAFVGLAASWDVWDFGQSYYAIEEANARVSQVEASKRKVRDLLLLEARKRLLDMRTAGKALAVAEATVVQAEESYRLESVRFEENAKTATDLVVAQSQLTMTRLQRESAFYDYLVALAALRRAMGEPQAIWGKP